MSLITRCPACQTTFRVVPDQLRISQGWVRCGQCQHIFDANAALVHGAADEASNNPSIADIELQPDQLATDETAGLKEPPLAEPDPAQTTDLLLPFGVDDEPALAPVTAAAAADAPPVAAQPDSAPPAARLAQEPPVEAARQDLSFMRSMPEPSSWQRTMWRAALGLVALALLAGLGLQVAVHERDRIATMFPQAKPALLWVCQHAKCSISGLRQIESVVIDSSSLNKVRGDAYSLSLVLRNTSVLDLAMPALELTLTDSQDQAVMRRVLLAKEYSPTNLLGASADWSGAVSIAVRGNGSAERFSGYRVLAFYP